MTPIESSSEEESEQGEERSEIRPSHVDPSEEGDEEVAPLVASEDVNIGDTDASVTSNKSSDEDSVSVVEMKS